MEPIRVLQEDVIMGAGGMEAFLMNVYRHIDREALQFDFMVHREEEGCYEEEILNLGGKIYRTPKFNPFKMHAFRKGIEDVITSHPEYKVIHCHTELNLWPLKYAHKLGVPVRIAHRHNAKTVLNLKYFFFLYERMFIKRHCTDMFMCSSPAGEWAYGKNAVESGKVKLIKNGIETERFRFDQTVREEVRRELGLGNKTAIGHVGRFDVPKNHTFLIDIFEQIHRKNPNTVLVMAGEQQGPIMDNMKKKVEKLGLTDCVQFLGMRRDVNRIYQAMDMFIFPSLWEGLPLTVIEAQTSGLPVLMSDVIAGETVVTPNVDPLSLDLGAEQWADAALKKLEGFDRRDCSGIVTDAGFDIRTTAAFLQEFYIEQTLKARRAQQNK